MKNPDARFSTIGYTALLLCIMSMAACLDRPTFQACGDGLCPADWLCGHRGYCLSPENCGNGRHDPGEACDDGNHEDGDGCSADCLSDERCGNGTIDPGEVCDDGGADGGCAPDCLSDDPPADMPQG